MRKSEKLKLAIKKEKEKEKAKKEKELEKKRAEQLKIELQEIKLKRNWLGSFKDNRKRAKPERLIVINMELANGMHKTFFIADDKGDSFKWNKKRYILDPEMKYYNIDFKEYMYDYHENFDLPIKRIFPINDIKTAIETSKMIESEYATNPSTLERFMNSNIIEMMLRGGAIDKMMKILMISVFIIGFIALIHLVLYMNQTGMFENLGI